MDVHILTHSFLDSYNGRTNKVFGGGLERYLYDLCLTIQEMRHRPVVHQLSFKESFDTEWLGIRVRGYAAGEEPMPDTFGRMAQGIEGPLIYASFIWQPLRYRPGSIGICHGINWDQPQSPAEHKREIASNIQEALNQLDYVVTVDSHFLTFCRAVCTYEDPDKIVLLPNAVDTTLYVPSEPGEGGLDGKVRILYPRRISYERGIIPMMLAADALLAGRDDVVFQFAGEVIEGDVLSQAFEVWMLVHPHRDRIVHKVYPFEQMAEAYQQADIAVIPTIFSEGTSYSCLEALSCGLPVISSNVGGLNDLIIDGFNGVLITPTVEKLTAAIDRLAGDPQLREELGRRARETAFAFDKPRWKAAWRGMLDTYLRRY